MLTKYKLTNTRTNEYWVGDACELCEIVGCDKYRFWTMINSRTDSEWKIEKFKKVYEVYEFKKSYMDMKDIADDLGLNYGSLANTLNGGTNKLKGYYIEVKNDR